MNDSPADPDFSLLKARMRDLVDSGKFAGISTMISQRGKVIHFDPVGSRDLERNKPIERDTIFRLASMSKPVTSVAALILVEEGLLQLSAPISQWLPEAAEMKVLRTPGGPIDDVVLAHRAPTLFDLMTHTAGFAWGKGLGVPITAAMDDATGQTPFVPHDPDSFVRRVCALPLVQQPGTGWHYSNSTDLLGVIIARASGQGLAEFLRERIFEAIGMPDTGFWAVPEAIDRLSVGYVRDDQGQLVVHDDARGGFWSRPPIFPAGGGGLLSTQDDFLSFIRMLLNKGVVGDRRIISESSVDKMTSNQLTAAQLQPLHPGVDFLQGQGFGLGVSVTLEQRRNRRSPGSFSWPGGYGTTWFADPQKDLVAILMSQVWMESQAELGPAFEDAVYKGISGGDPE